LEPLLHPLILYAGLALGGVGVYLAMPRRGSLPQGIGALVAAAGAGLIMLTLTLTAGEARPNWFFHIFALIALGAALRVITHPRPVYAALYFILTILSTAGLFLLLSAEFLAFALIIIYAGAILITYLFVIMLATQAPSEEQTDALPAYDAVGREPVAATIVGFLLLGAMTGMMNIAVPQMTAAPTGVTGQEALAEMPRKVERALVNAGLPEGFVIENVIHARNPDAPYAVLLTVPDSDAQRFREALDAPTEALAALGRPLFLRNQPRPLSDSELAAGMTPGQPTWTLAFERLPESLSVNNLERVGMALIARHPLALELAGVILLLALVGAVVLARKQIEIGDAERLEAARKLREAAL
jgi:NADH-quinone oxidoreductase subunit J